MIVKNKVLINFLWKILDKIFILILQFFIGVKIANHYGSLEYGKYIFLLSIINLFQIFYSLFDEKVVKKELAKNKKQLMNTLLSIKILFNLLVVIIAIFFVYLNMYQDYIFLFILLIINSFFQEITTTIMLIFDYNLNSKYIVLVNNLIKIIIIILQYIVIKLNYDINFIVFSSIIGGVIGNLIIFNIYKKLYKLSYNFELNRRLAQDIIKKSYHLWTSFICFLIYTQIDKFIIVKFLRIEDVAVYNIAVNLSNVLLILIGPLRVSVFPLLFQLYTKNREEYMKIYLSLNRLITVIYIIIIILSIPILNITFSFVYTVEYNEAKIIYSILSFGIIFKVVSFLQTTHFILEEKTAKITFKMIIGVFLNFLLNFLLLKLNLKGIAIATTVTQILTLYLLDYFITEYREIFFLQTNSFKFWKVKDDIKNIQLLKSITLEIEDDLLKKVEE
ncbi:hypothetical protein DW663_10905 [Fusobacterium mortiferum]|uniref:Uncharacterized protein n=1 Tax=Fusobacterium mortiferum TaxID=850 RepID=A0A414PP96_FUSMR|nr:oligosaccharide flippase family protein [Fusobacterium mortiferum]RHF70336.1 hypothetical protein DW663_10905 [Fusobacterium mortiferum]